MRIQWTNLMLTLLMGGISILAQTAYAQAQGAPISPADELRQRDVVQEKLTLRAQRFARFASPEAKQTATNGLQRLGVSLDGLAEGKEPAKSHTSAGKSASTEGLTADYDVAHVSQVLAGLADDSSADEGVQRALTFLEKQRSSQPVTDEEMWATAALGASGTAFDVAVLARWQEVSAVLVSLASQALPLVPLPNWPQNDHSSWECVAVATVSMRERVSLVLALNEMVTDVAQENRLASVPVADVTPCAGYYLIAQTNVLLI